VASDEQPAEGRKLRPGVVLAVVLGVAFVAFVLQNRHKVKVQWLFFEFHAPFYLVEFGTIALAIVAAELIGTAIRRSRAKRKSG
jgi:uncharacterized integral membrane protein